jgi:hypothetical protein
MVKTIPQFKVTDPADDPLRAFVHIQPTISLAPSSGSVQRAAPRTVIYKVRPERFDN